MTTDEIIRMAREAGFLEALQPEGDLPAVWNCCSTPELERFAALIAAAEREACAKVCEETTAAWTQHLYNEGCMNCAAAIRARGQE